MCGLIIEEEAQTAVNCMIDRRSKDVNFSAAMLLTYSLLTIVLLGETSGQLFGRLGFGFPGFSAPEAFEDDPFTDMQQRISDLMKGSAKPKKGVKTKIKTEQRGDENVTTIEQKGKGFDSWARLTTFGDKMKGSGKSISKMMSGLFGGEIKAKGDKKSECSGQKPCLGEKYCDPIEGVCKDKSSEGERCFMKDQCKFGSICLWGRCSPGRQGQSGTFCSKDKDCVNENYCSEDPKISIFQPICKPKLAEGASCGSLNPFGLIRIAIGKRDTSEDAKLKHPCKTGLKCEQVGMFGGMVCVPESLKIKKEANKVELEEEKKPGGEEEESEEEEEEEEAQSGQQEGEDERPDNEEGGDIVPSKQQKNNDDEPTNIMNAKPQGQSNKDGSNNSPGNGMTQTGQQKLPTGQKPQPIPGLKPIGQPNSNKNGGKKKHKKKKQQRKEKDD